MSDRVFIFDTTLRDGEQSCGCSMTVAEKLRMARKLVELNVDVMEAGFPMASDGDFEAVRAVAQALRHTVVAGLCRALPGDIDRAWEALKEAKHPRIHTFLATSDIHLEHKLRMSREDALAMAIAVPAPRSWRGRRLCRQTHHIFRHLDARDLYSKKFLDAGNHIGAVFVHERH